MTGAGLAIVAALMAQAEPDRELTVKDINASVEAMAKFEQAARDGTDANKAAINVCRLLFSESVRGIDFTMKAFNNYTGPDRQILSFVCEGYMQGGYDTLKALKSTTRQSAPTSQSDSAANPPSGR